MNVVSILPLDSDIWSDLEILFGSRGACSGCLYMNYRCLKNYFELGKGEIYPKRLQEKDEEVKSTVFLAYKAGILFGWISIAPKSAFPRMQKSRIM